MAELFSSGRAIDLILAGIALEALVLYAVGRSGRVRGLPPLDWLPSLTSGALIMLALRAAVSGVAWPLLSLLLMSSGAAHGFDLWLRRRTRLRLEAAGSPVGASPRPW